MHTISKSTRKPHDMNRVVLVKKLAAEYRVTEQTVRAAINDRMTTETCQRIKRQYLREYEQLIKFTTPKIDEAIKKATV